MKKKLGACLLTLSLLSTGTTSIMASHINAIPEDTLTVNVYEGNTLIEVIEVEASEEISLTAGRQARASKCPWLLGAKSLPSSTQKTYDFSMSGDYKYFKVWVNNTGSANIVVSVTSGTSTGTQVGSGTITAGRQGIVAPNKSFSNGKYYINLTSGKAKMSGTINVRIASTYAELDV